MISIVKGLGHQKKTLIMVVLCVHPPCKLGSKKKNSFNTQMFNKFGAYKSDFILFWRVPSDNKEQQIFLVVSMWLLWFLWNDKNIKILLEIENCRAFFLDCNQKTLPQSVMEFHLTDKHHWSFISLTFPLELFFSCIDTSIPYQFIFSNK